MIALFRSATKYCDPEIYCDEWWLVEAELLPTTSPQEGNAVVVDGIVPMFDTKDGHPERLLLFSLLNLETMEMLSNCGPDLPEWAKDPLLVAMKVAQFKESRGIK